MTVRMRHTRSHTRNRRSHHALGQEQMITCKECGSLRIQHRVCTNCGMYRGKKIIDMKKVNDKKKERSEKKAKSMGKEA